MAKLERELNGNFDELLDHLHTGILTGSASASYEAGSDYGSGRFRCAVRVYERYSIAGGNRVSLNLTLAGEGDRLFLSAITSGGSQAIRFKINTLSEHSFLSLVSELLDRWHPSPERPARDETQEERLPCPVCGNYTLSAEAASDYHLCPVCGWIDDPWTAEHPEEPGNYNEVSLMTARRSYQLFGACTEAMRGRVRPPEPEELPEIYSRIHDSNGKGLI